MDTQPHIDFDALTDQLHTRLQLLRYRTQCLRAWRALHRQSWKARKLRIRRMLTSESVHRAAVIVTTGESDLVPVWIN